MQTWATVLIFTSELLLHTTHFFIQNIFIYAPIVFIQCATWQRSKDERTPIRLCPCGIFQIKPNKTTKLIENNEAHRKRSFSLISNDVFQKKNASESINRTHLSMEIEKLAISDARIQWKFTNFVTRLNRNRIFQSYVTIVKLLIRFISLFFFLRWPHCVGTWPLSIFLDYSQNDRSSFCFVFFLYIFLYAYTKYQWTSLQWEKKNLYDRNRSLFTLPGRILVCNIKCMFFHVIVFI